MTENEKELLDTLKLARSYIANDNNNIVLNDLVYRTPAQSLREEADRIERKEKDINNIDKIIEKYSTEKNDN